MGLVSLTESESLTPPYHGHRPDTDWCRSRKHVRNRGAMPRDAAANATSLPRPVVHGTHVIVTHGRGRSLLGGRMVGPDYTKPAVPMTPAYKEPDGCKTVQPSDHLPRGRWWTISRDPDLDALEEQIGAANQNLRIAEARLRQAGALVRFCAAYDATWPAIVRPRLPRSSRWRTTWPHSAASSRRRSSSGARWSRSCSSRTATGAAWTITSRSSPPGR
jgi:hypothetical protein